MVRVGLEIRLGGTPPYSAWEEIYTALFHQTVSTETEREKKKLNEKALYVYGSSPPAPGDYYPDPETQTLRARWL